MEPLGADGAGKQRIARGPFSQELHLGARRRRTAQAVADGPAEVLLADLRSSVFKDKTFKYHRNDPTTGTREVVTAGAADESAPDDAT